MKQRYNEITRALLESAVIECYQGKWHRTEFLTYAEKTSGISRHILLRDGQAGDWTHKIEAVKAMAAALDEMISEILAGGEPEDMEPVQIDRRKDGMTQKVRDIATLSIPHQLLGHTIKLALEPMLNAWILPQQHASIPGRGQTGLARQAAKYLRSGSKGISYIRKADVRSAYASLRYSKAIELIAERVPSAVDVIELLNYVATLAPNRSLIIGGYLDAWLYNFCMSCLLRDVLQHGQTRRGKRIRYITAIECYMDDVTIMTRTKTAMAKACRIYERRAADILGVQIKWTTGLISLMPAEMETAQRSRDRPSEHGCPCLDMGGYRMSRTHTTMRPRVCKRIRRAYMRAWTEYRRTGSLQIQRAQRVLSYYGIIKNSNSCGFCAKYHVYEVRRIARAVCSFYGRLQAAKIKARRARYIERAEKRYIGGMA